jgi:hypothetical protein
LFKDLYGSYERQWHGDQDPRQLVGVVFDRGTGRVCLDGLNALLGVGFRLIALAGSNDLAVGGLEVEAELAGVSQGDSSTCAQKVCHGEGNQDLPLSRPARAKDFARVVADCVRASLLGWLPAPAVVVLANYALAITGHPRCSTVAFATHFAGLVAIALVGLRVAA